MLIHYRTFPKAKFFQMDAFQEKCLAKIDEDCEEVIESESFLEATPDVIADILDRDSLKVAEINLYRAFVEWQTRFMKQTNLKESQQKKTQKIQELLWKIRFILMKQNDFIKKVIPDKLLEPEDIVQVLTQFNSFRFSKIYLNPRKGYFGEERKVLITAKNSEPAFDFRVDANIYLTKVKVRFFSKEIPSMTIKNQTGLLVFHRTNSKYPNGLMKCQIFEFSRPFYVQSDCIQNVCFDGPLLFKQREVKKEQQVFVNELNRNCIFSSTFYEPIDLDGLHRNCRRTSINKPLLNFDVTLYFCCSQ